MGDQAEIPDTGEADDEKARMFRLSTRSQSSPPATGRAADGALEGRHALLLVRLANLGDLERVLGPAMSGVQSTFAARVRDALPEEATVWQAEQGTIALGFPGVGPAASVRLGRRLVAEVSEETVPSPAGPIGLKVVVGAASTTGGGGGRLGAAARGALEEALRRHLAVVHRDGDQQRHARREAEERALDRAAIRAATGAGLATVFCPVYRAERTGLAAFHHCLPRFEDGNGIVRGARDLASAVDRLGLTPFLDRAVISAVLEGLARSPRSRVSYAVSGASLSDGRLAVEIAARANTAPDVAERLILQIDARDWPAEGKPAAVALARTRALGCGIALADLRLTSLPLSALSQGRVDMLSLSPALAADASTNPDARMEIRTIREFALHHGLLTIAPGVESPEQAAALRGLGIDCLEGPAAGEHTDVPAEGADRPGRPGLGGWERAEAG